MSKRKIRLPRLSGLAARLAPKTRPAVKKAAPTRPRYDPSDETVKADLRGRASRGRTRAKYGPEGKPARTRAQLADRAERRPTTGQYGYRETPASDRPEAKPRPYPARKISNLREKPQTRAGARFQLHERAETLAHSRQRKPAQGLGPNSTRAQLANRPKHGTQVHTYPEPYERRTGHTDPVVGRRSDKPHPARGAVPRPRSPLPGDATPTGRMGGSMAGGGKPHPYFSRKG